MHIQSGIYNWDFLSMFRISFPISSWYSNYSSNCQYTILILWEYITHWSSWINGLRFFSKFNSFFKITIGSSMWLYFCNILLNRYPVWELFFIIYVFLFKTSQSYLLARSLYYLAKSPSVQWCRLLIIINGFYKVIMVIHPPICQ